VGERGRTRRNVGGIVWQPVQLQPGCWLVPAPDHFLLLQPNVLELFVIPPAARPVQFWAQAVELRDGLRPRMLYWIDAR
jgi:hypothetical protein